jgi:hypothetical protein
VNRLGKNGVQIEHSKEARKIYVVQIVDAIADVIGPKIKVCTALVTACW